MIQFRRTFRYLPDAPAAWRSGSLGPGAGRRLGGGEEGRDGKTVSNGQHVRRLFLGAG